MWLDVAVVGDSHPEADSSSAWAGECELFQFDTLG